MARVEAKQVGIWKPALKAGRNASDGASRWRDRLPDDGAVMRGLFYAMLVAIIVGLGYDYRLLLETQSRTEAFQPLRSQPVLPSYRPNKPGDRAPAQSVPNVTANPDDLRSRLSVSLGSGGVLNVTGTIDPGSAERFREEINRVGEYVKTVALNSPGGSVRDALSISRLIREKGLNTSVATGALCASSCPLVFAAGIERIAGSGAAIGVHQVFSGMREGPRNVDLEISSTQRLTADINRHLEEMGAVPDLWLHALDTPPDKLYYFTDEELTGYRLATGIQDKSG